MECTFFFNFFSLFSFTILSIVYDPKTNNVHNSKQNRKQNNHTYRLDTIILLKTIRCNTVLLNVFTEKLAPPTYYAMMVITGKTIPTVWAVNTVSSF